MSDVVKQAVLKVRGEFCTSMAQLIKQNTGKDIEVTGKQINAGYCDHFAVALCITLHGEGLIESTVAHNSDLDCSQPYQHTFVQCDNRFYDAESPDGVDNWRELPFFTEKLSSDESFQLLEDVGTVTRA